jgi:hypothetical protein
VKGLSREARSPLHEAEDRSPLHEAEELEAITQGLDDSLRRYSRRISQSYEYRLTMTVVVSGENVYHRYVIVILHPPCLLVARHWVHGKVQRRGSKVHCPPRPIAS